jgi:hypothetical protein
MAKMQTLSELQIEEVLRDAVDSQAALIVTVCGDNAWLNFHSRIVELRGGGLVVEAPTWNDGPGTDAFPPGRVLHLSFRLYAHKYLCNATALQWQRLPVGEDPQAPVLCVSKPTKMQRLQRRVCRRHDLPEGHLAPASFWLGEKENEPPEDSPEVPIWHGKVIDFGLYGVKLVADRNSAEAFELGDRVALRFSFGPGEVALYADSVYRYCRPNGGDDEEEVLMGFQFVGLDSTPHGQETFQIVAEKIEELRHAEQPTS